MGQVRNRNTSKVQAHTNAESKRHTYYYQIDTDKPEWRAIWLQFIEEIHDVIQASGVEVTDPNGNVYSSRHGSLY